MLAEKKISPLVQRVTLAIGGVHLLLVRDLKGRSEAASTSVQAEKLTGVPLARNYSEHDDRWEGASGGLGGLGGSSEIQGQKTSNNQICNKYVKLGIKRGLDSSPASTEVRHLSRSLVRRGEAAPAARRSLRSVVGVCHALKRWGPNSSGLDIFFVIFFHICTWLKWCFFFPVTWYFCMIQI